MKISIFGSCVSRDSFEFAALPSIELVCYVARSSLASAFSDHRVARQWDPELSMIQSGFQRRMVEWDLARQAGRRLLAPKPDAILLDLIDERFSIILIGGAPVTLSKAFVDAGLVLSKEPHELRPGCDARRRLWKKGARKMVDEIGADRIILNKTYWALKFDDGTYTKNREYVERMNADLAWMYAELFDERVTRTIEYPPALIRADARHKWGPAPFHYTREFYVFAMDALKSHLLDIMR